MTTRRSLLRGAAVGSVALALGACVNGQFDEATAAQDVATIAAGLKGAFQSPGFTVPQAAKDAVADVQAVASSFAKATTQAAAQDLVSRIETDVNAIVTALASISLPINIATVLAAAQALLPVLEAAVGMAVSAQVKAKASKMSPVEARLVLLSAAAR